METTPALKKVLIVDDDKNLLEMYALKFKEKEFEVVSALGSLDALQKLKDGIAPDVILMDVVMPEMDGFELLATIKNDSISPNSKVVMLSNLGQREDIERGRSLGASGYIIKASATPSEVVEKVLFIWEGGDLFAEME